MGVPNAPGSLRAAPLPPPDNAARQRLMSGYGGHDEKDRPRTMESVRVAARMRPHAPTEVRAQPCEDAVYMTRPARDQPGADHRVSLPLRQAHRKPRG